MQPFSRSTQGLIALALVVLMVGTRFKHFGDALHLPDASMTVFFLGGLYLRRFWAFAGFVALSVLIDEVSIHYAGISDFCVTVAYAFLPLAYLMLWLGGRWAGRQLDDQPRSYAYGWLAALVAAAASFAISNGSFYWLGGRYVHPHMSEYLARLGLWGPLFLRTTMSYVTVALLLHAGLRRLTREHAAVRA